MKKKTRQFVADKTAVKSIALQDRDVDFLTLLLNERVLNLKHAHELMLDRHPDLSMQVLRRRAMLLFHHGYIRRPKVQIAFWEKGSNSRAYDISKKGVSILRARPETASLVRGVKAHWNKPPAHSYGHFAHNIGTTHIHYGMHRAARESGYEYDSIRDSEPLHITTYLRNPSQRFILKPDRRFYLQSRTSTGKKRRVNFLVEWDEGTMPLRRQKSSGTDIYKKLLGYWNWILNGGVRRDYGVPSIFILFPTIDLTRARKIQELAKSIDRIKRTGSRVFWSAHFTTKHDYDQLLEPIWYTAKDGEKTFSVFDV